MILYPIGFGILLFLVTIIFCRNGFDVFISALLFIGGSIYCSIIITAKHRAQKGEDLGFVCNLIGYAQTLRSMRRNRILLKDFSLSVDENDDIYISYKDLGKPVIKQLDFEKQLNIIPYARYKREVLLRKSCWEDIYEREEKKGLPHKEAIFKDEHNTDFFEGRMGRVKFYFSLKNNEIVYFCIFYPKGAKSMKDLNYSEYHIKKLLKQYGHGLTAAEKKAQEAHRKVLEKYQHISADDALAILKDLINEHDIHETVRKDFGIMAKRNDSIFSIDPTVVNTYGGNDAYRYAVEVAIQSLEAYDKIFNEIVEIIENKNITEDEKEAFVKCLKIIQKTKNELSVFDERWESRGRYYSYRRNRHELDDNGALNI